MPNSTFPAVISFADKKNKQPVITTERSDAEDFGIRMTNAVEVQEIDINLYMSKELWLPVGARGAFGGQIVAQALSAAFHTLDEEFKIHSLHSYFILPGNVEMPVLYHVQCLRDGRSYATRHVTATQRGKAIFVCSFSFAKTDPSTTLQHQTMPPDVPDPESLPSEDDTLQRLLTKDSIPPKYKEYIKLRMEENLPIDYRQIKMPSSSSIARRWFKTRGTLPSNNRLHACVITFASDSGFYLYCCQANEVPPNGIAMMASLDHSMWFHSPARADDWLLYDVHSPRTSDGRGVVFGRIYNRQGVLIATAAQEGIVRLSKHEQDKRVNSVPNKL